MKYGNAVNTHLWYPGSIPGLVNIRNAGCKEDRSANGPASHDLFTCTLLGFIIELQIGQKLNDFYPKNVPSFDVVDLPSYSPEGM